MATVYQQVREKVLVEERQEVADDPHEPTENAEAGDPLDQQAR